MGKGPATSNIGGWMERRIAVSDRPLDGQCPQRSAGHAQCPDGQIESLLLLKVSRGKKFTVWQCVNCPADSFRALHID